MANQFNWALGQEGKGNVYDDGSISTWRTDETRSPHHYEIGQQDEKTPRFHFYLSPEGGMWDGGTTFQNQTPYSDDQVVKQVVEKHPAVWDGRNALSMDWDEGGDWSEPEERVEMPGGGYGHAEDLLRMTHKLASSGWADFHTEFKIPRGVRKQIRRWVDKLKWPDEHEKHDAREYHITVLDMDEYDDAFAKWARKETQGKSLSFKSTGMDMFNEFIVVRLECPEWEDLAQRWTEEADKRGLEPHKFPGGPKAHISVGRSQDKKWPRGVPNPHVQFETRMFNIKRNSAIGDPWQPGNWGKGFIDPTTDEAVTWNTNGGPAGGEEDFRGQRPHHIEVAAERHGVDFPQIERAEELGAMGERYYHSPITISPNGEYVSSNDLNGSYEPDGQEGRFQRENPSLRYRGDTRDWSYDNEAANTGGGFGHAKNITDILNKQSGYEPADDLAKWLDSFTVEQAAPPSLHHTDGDQFTPQIVAPVVQTPHVDPPKQPYKPYNWAEEGWEASPMDRMAATTRTQQLQQAQQLEQKYGPDQSEPVHQFSNGWSMRQLKTYGDAIREGELMSNCLSPYRVEPESHHSVWSDHPQSMWEENGAPSPRLHGEYVGVPDPDSIDPTPPLGENVWSLRDPDNLPHGTIDEVQALGRHNDPLKPQYEQMVNEWENPPTDRTSMAADPEWLNEYMERKGPYLYHTTHPDNVPSILQHGIVPWDQLGDRGTPADHGTPFLTPRPGHTYLRQLTPANPGADSPGLIRVDLSKLDHTLMNPDEDSMQLGGPGWRDKWNSLGEKAEAQKFESPAATRRSLEREKKTMAYRGVIPPEALDAPNYASPVTAHTHQCPQCGAMIDGQICGECGYNPTSATGDYQKMKSEWYDQAWSHPGDQPRPVPNQPMHWRDDHAKDVTLARKETDAVRAISKGGWSVEIGDDERGSADHLSSLWHGESRWVEADQEENRSDLRWMQSSVSGASEVASSVWHEI